MNLNKIILIAIKLITSYPLLLNLIAEFLEKLSIPFPKGLSEILFVPKYSEFKFALFFYIIQTLAFIGFFIHWYFYQRKNSEIITSQGYSVKYLLGILGGQILFSILIFFIDSKTFKKLQEFIM